jgi:hypothetical protein
MTDCQKLVADIRSGQRLGSASASARSPRHLELLERSAGIAIASLPPGA